MKDRNRKTVRATERGTEQFLSSHWLSVVQESKSSSKKDKKSQDFRGFQDMCCILQLIEGHLISVLKCKDRLLKYKYFKVSNITPFVNFHAQILTRNNRLLIECINIIKALVLPSNHNDSQHNSHNNLSGFWLPIIFKYLL